MLNANNLATDLTNAMSEADNPADAHSNFTNALKSYLSSNIEIQGTYEGTLSGNPDPANGSYQWQGNAVNISSSGLQSAATGGMSGWEDGLKTELAKIQFSGADKTGVVTIGTVTLTISSVSIDMSSKPDNMNAAMQKVAEGIVGALTSAAGNPTSTPATSSTGGAGTVTFGAVS